MYLHIGQDYILNEEDILGIFDMDNTSSSYRTRAFLSRAEKEGEMCIRDRCSTGRRPQAP